MHLTNWLLHFFSGARSATSNGIKSTTNRRQRRQQRQLGGLEGLESRILLTTELTLSAGALVITDIANGGQADTLTVTSDAANSKYVISDPNQTFIATGIVGAVVSGNQHSVDVPFSSVSGNQITVNLLSGADSVNVTSVDGSFNAGLTILDGAGADTVTVTGDVTFPVSKSLIVNADTFNTASGVDVVTSGTGVITVSADTIDLALTSTLVSPGVVTITQLTAGRGIALTQAQPNQLYLSDPELDRITAGTLVIGDASSGNLVVYSPGISPAVTSTLRLNSGASVGGTDIVVDNLAISAGVGVLIDGNLTNVTNFAASTTTGSISFVDANTLTITSVAGVDGVSRQSGLGSISLNVTAGNLTVLDTPAAEDMTAQGILITLSGSGAVFTTATGSVVHNFGGALFTISADEMDLHGTLSSDASVRLQPQTAGVKIVLGSNPVQASTLELSAAELALITAPGTVYIGGQTSSVAGDITITAPLSGSFSGLQLVTSGAVIDANSTGVDITVDTLSILSGQGIGASGPDLVLETQAKFLGFQNSTSGNISISNSGAVSLLANGPGLFNNGGSISVANTGSITVAVPIATLGNGDLSLTAQGGTTSDIFVQGTASTVGGGLTLTASRNIVITSVQSSGLATASGLIALYSDSDLNGNGRVEVSRPINLGSLGMEIKSSGLDGIISSVISGTGSVLLAGPGTVTFTAANTYNGSTQINSGRLNIDGSLAGNVQVNQGGTLGGTGSLNGGLTANNGGIVAPGHSPGILSAGNPALQSGSTLSVELNGTTVGTEYDQLNNSGIVALSNVTLDISLGYIPSVGDTFQIINNRGTNTGTGTFNGLPENGTKTVDGIVFQISYVAGTNNNDVVLTVTQVPEAPSLVVTTKTDVVNPYDNLTSLREALAYANTNSSTKTVSFAAALNGQAILLTQGELLITAPVTIAGNGTTNTIIDGQTNSRIFRINDLGQAISVGISNVTLQNGHAVEPLVGVQPHDGDGGAILTDDLATLTISGSVLNSNKSDVDGGAILNLGTLHITGTTFTGNKADENNISFSEGGAIFNAASGTLTVSSSTFTSNFASEDGGAILNDNSATIDNSTFTLNTTGDDAGAIDNQNGLLTINTSSFTQNTVGDVGGAIRISGGTAIISNSLLAGNFAPTDSGAIHNDGDLTIINTTISGNTTNGVGGGVYVHGGTLRALSSTLTLNRADADGNGGETGGGIYSESAGQATLGNTIVAGNLIGAGAVTANDIDGGTLVGTSSFNLIGDAGSAGGLTQGTNNNLVGTNPQLAALSNNGGPTKTHALLAGSPALNHGSNLLVTSNQITTDQRAGAFVRTFDTTTDIGAYEFQPSQATAAITPDNVYSNANSITFTIQFDIGVTGFDSGDVIVTNGTKGVFTTVNDHTYTLTVIPSSDGVVSASILANATTIGNNSAMGSVTSDRTPPQLTITPNATATNSATTTFTFQFSENVTDFDATDITVTNGSKGTFIAVDGDTYTLVVTPSADGLVSVNVGSNAASDVATNGNAAASASITSDRSGPVFSSPNAASVAENSTAVLIAASTDLDGPATYAIHGGADFSLFAINATTGALQFITPPDFENPADSDIDNIYHVQIRATDTLGEVTDQDITVTVTAVNDNDPAFTSSPSFSVAENQAAVGTVMATDADKPAQGVTFTITGGADAGKFNITAQGALTFITAPDFESQSSYVVTVTATDDGSPARSISQNLVITVTNANEAPTEISLAPTSVNEQQPAGTTVGAFTTTDPDSGDTFTYSLVSGDGSTDNQKFQITGNTLKTNAVLSFNTQSSYSIRVRSTDAGELSFEKIFTIQLSQVGISLLDLGGPSVTWIKRQPAVTVVPQITVNNNLSLTGGTLTLSMATIGSKKKALDNLVIPTISLGATNTISRTSMLTTITIHLGAGDTASEIQSFLRDIQFSTKGKGLKALTRTLNVTLADNDGHSTHVAQTIHVVKKVPK